MQDAFRKQMPSYCKSLLPLLPSCKSVVAVPILVSIANGLVICRGPETMDVPDLPPDVFNVPFEEMNMAMPEIEMMFDPQHGMDKTSVCLLS
jgi:hypothetical protein